MDSDFNYWLPVDQLISVWLNRLCLVCHMKTISTEISAIELSKNTIHNKYIVWCSLIGSGGLHGVIL